MAEPQLAPALDKAGGGEALTHYRAAVHLAQTVRPELQAELVPAIEKTINRVRGSSR